MTALTWGHNDRRIFVAVGCDVLTVVVLKRVASLQLLCGRRIQHRLIDESSIFQLPLPNKLQAAITELFAPTIKVRWCVLTVDPLTTTSLGSDTTAETRGCKLENLWQSLE